MSMRQHMKEHHGVEMHENADEGTVQNLHHHDHTFNRPGHKLTEHLMPVRAKPTPSAATKSKPVDEAAAQRAKSDRWKPR